MNRLLYSQKAADAYGYWSVPDGKGGLFFYTAIYELKEGELDRNFDSYFKHGYRWDDKVIIGEVPEDALDKCHRVSYGRYGESIEHETL